MEAGNRKSLKDRMEQASLNELMPGFDKEVEWMQLSARMHGAQKPRSVHTWRYAAAVLLLVGGSLVAYFVMNNDSPQQVAANTTQSVQQWSDYVLPGGDADGGSSDVNSTVAVIENGAEPAKGQEKADAGKKATSGKRVTIAAGKVRRASQTAEVFYNYYHAKEYVCNGTPCPLEICIVQSIKCQNSKPSAVATCSIIDPDQAGQVGYKVIAPTTQRCKTTVKEIRIKRIPTGETIVLNDHTKPATAQDVFNYITGQKKGDILAGVFETDCDNDCNINHLKVDNNYGDLILQ